MFKDIVKNWKIGWLIENVCELHSPRWEALRLQIKFDHRFSRFRSVVITMKHRPRGEKKMIHPL